MYLQHTVRTKFREAIINLLPEKEYNKITIKDICSKAHSSYSTFYKYYLNIDNILAEITYSNLQQHEKIMQTEMSLCERLILMLSFIKNNTDFFVKYLDNPITTQNINQINILVLNRYKSCCIKRTSLLNCEQKESYRLFVQSGINGLISRWIQNDCKTEPSSIADDLIMLIDIEEQYFFD